MLAISLIIEWVLHLQDDRNLISHFQVHIALLQASERQYRIKLSFFFFPFQMDIKELKYFYVYISHVLSMALPYVDLNSSFQVHVTINLEVVRNRD